MQPVPRRQRPDRLRQLKRDMRYVVLMPNADGSFRVYWRPTPQLRKQGFAPQRLDDRNTPRAILTDHDKAALFGAAAAKPLNDALDRWRAEGGQTAALASGYRIDTGPQPGSVAWLVETYKADTAVSQAKAAKTVAFYKPHLETISRVFGDRMIAELEPATIRKRLYAPIEERAPAQAQAAVRTLSMLYSYGWQHVEGFTAIFFASGLQVPKDFNPAKKLDTNYKRQVKPQIIRAPGTAQLVAMADAMGYPSIGTACVVGHWFGQRKGDILALPRRLYLGEGATIDMTQMKTGADVHLPKLLIDDVTARLDAELARQADRGVEGTTLLLDEDTGKPWDAYRFSKIFRTIRQAAACGDVCLGIEPMPDVARFRFMWFRHSCVVHLAEAGCDDKLIASITGHTLASITAILNDHYWQPTAEQAAQAIMRRLAHERG